MVPLIKKVNCWLVCLTSAKPDDVYDSLISNFHSGSIVFFRNIFAYEGLMTEFQIRITTLYGYKDHPVAGSGHSEW